MIDVPHTVMLIEDTRDDELLSLRALRKCGLPMVVKVAHDGVEALRKLGVGGEARQVPDLIISDLKMPRLSGDQVLRSVRADEHLKEVPFIVFSSSDEPTDVRRCMTLGATAFATKPVSFSEYIDCLAAIARHWLEVACASKEPSCVIEAEGAGPSFR